MNSPEEHLNAWKLDSQNHFTYALSPVYFCSSFPKPALCLPWGNVADKHIQRLVTLEKWVLR